MNRNLIENKIRIGLILHNNMIPAWQFKMLQILKERDSNQINLIIIIREHRKKNSDQNKLIYNTYNKLDKRLYGGTNSSMHLKNINTILDVERLFVQDKVIPNDIEKITDYNLDILINLNDSCYDGLLNTAKYGVWSYYYGRNGKNNYPPGFWEVTNRMGEVEVGVRKKDGVDQKILYRSFSFADNLSVNRGLDEIKWKMSSFIPRIIEELVRLGEVEFLIKVVKLNKGLQNEDDKTYSFPTNLQIIFNLLKFQSIRIKNILKGFFMFHQWMLLFYIDESSKLSTSFDKFKRILPPKDRFWADPHIVKKGKNYFIFIEELIYKEGKGFISVIEMDEYGNYKNPIKVLEEDFHLSYPFIFEDNGEIYMIPESQNDMSIRLYKCVDFPENWKFEKKLMVNVKAVDTTIFFHNNRYWLFTNIVENKGASVNDELFLFSSDQLVSGEWESHPDNPIVSDVKRSRSAGAIFKDENGFYRPSQNCSNIYGYGIQINKIKELSKVNYEEELVKSILPNWEGNLLGTHTLGFKDQLTVIDVNLNRKK